MAAMQEETEALLATPQQNALYSYGSGSEVSVNSGENGFHCHDSSRTEQKETKKRAIRVLWLSVFVCLFFMICEVVGGIWAQSLAIITDAAHLLTDLASMLISLFSLYIAGRPASQRMSFGWHRAEVVGAFISVFMIWVVTGVLVYLAIDRIITHQYDINAPIMAITAGIGVGVNLVMGLLLYFGGHGHSHGGMPHSHSHAQQPTADDGVPEVANGSVGSLPSAAVNINVRAAFIHVLGDLVQSIGVLIAGLVILWDDKWAVVDPICTLLFSVIVVLTTVYVIRDALVVLLEGRPSSINFRHVFDALEKIEGVRKVHNLRIWALSTDKVALSVHLEVDPDANAQMILKTTTLMLRERFGVHESTIQIEGYFEESENCTHCVVPPR
jgi:zinc transporter 2